MISELNESNFAEKTSEGLVLVDFFAEWCPPCRLLGPVLGQLHSVKIAKIDIDANQSLSEKFNIEKLPTMVFLKDGVEVKRFVGLQSQLALQAAIDKLSS